MSASLKAGLIGAGAAVLLSLLGLVPCLGCLTSILALVLYLGVGVLAATWMELPRDAGKGAGSGAVAGLITALGGGITNVIISAVRFTVGGGQAAIMRQFRQLPPEFREPWRDLGLDPNMLARPGFAIGSSAVCCGLGLLLAAALGAAAGAITVSLQRKPETSV
jgi:hypothetical protein